MSEEQIKRDLRELKYYYSHRSSVEEHFKVTGTTGIKNLARKYEAAIRLAPIRLYDLFGCLYIQSKTQEEIAIDFGCSVEYIRKLNKELYEFLIKQFKC